MEFANMYLLFLLRKLCYHDINLYSLKAVLEFYGSRE